MIKPSPFEIHCEVNTDTAYIIPAGELDIATAPQLEEQVQAMLAQSACHVVIDLSKLTFIDSSGLRLFIVLSALATAEGWTLNLIRPSGQALSVFQISGADESLPFIEDPRVP
jgi:anti-sigma B factor antagonist